MAQTYYAQSDHCPPTMTVGDLIEKLQTLDPSKPVVFRSPLYGAFGSNTAYSIERVDHVSMDRREDHTPGGVGFDEETGEEFAYEPYTQVFHAWEGVVIG